jgi:two-component system cell cycle sensor histidine kinase/response regulator CckA
VLRSQRALERIRRLEHHAETLATAARSFSEVMVDPQRLLATMARTFASGLGAACAVLVQADHQALLSVGALWPPEPEHHSSWFVPLAGQPTLRAVLESGQTFRGLVGELASSGAPDRGDNLLQRLGGEEVMVLSLGTRSRALGLLILTRPAALAFDEDDAALAESLGDQAALALSSTRLYAAERAARAAAEDAQAAFRHSEEAHRLLFEASPVPVYVFDSDSYRFIAANDSALALYGYSRDEFLGLRIIDLRIPEEVDATLEMLRRHGDAPMAGSARHRTNDGSIITVEYHSRSLTFAGRRARMAAVRDVTQQRRLEEQLRQAHKMEAIGRLAGGVGHDFNNVLTVILNYSDLMLADLSPDDDRRELMIEIKKAGTRAADLTRQLLTFSRQQVLAPQLLDLNHLIASLGKMLRRVLRDDITLVMLPAPDIGTIYADKGSLEQLLVNLVVNARDAMPTGGVVSITTTKVFLDEDFVATHPGARTGPHVRLTVSDTGVGIEAAAQALIFEPFFSTKDPSQGSGLGLSTVLGIVQQSDGQIDVHSIPGEGTTFTVYLPIADAGVPESAPNEPETLRGSEKILLVEDNDQVRLVVSGMLRRQGYDVMEAADAHQALELSDSHRGDIDLLLTDVVMPEISGTDLARTLAPLRPAMKVIFMSGYTDDATFRTVGGRPGNAFLQKPVSLKALAGTIRQVLDG